MEIGKQIKNYRTEMKLSQDDLAEKIYVSRQTISNWENDKNYPDVKSLVLLSSLFGVSLDNLVKGDLEEMKEKITADDMQRFQKESTIFCILMVSMIISLVPLWLFGGYIGLGIWALIVILTLFYSFRIEKLKKRFDIQTYKEILAFLEKKNLTEIEKNREYGKRHYQKFVLVLGIGIIAFIATAIMTFLCKLI